MSHPLDDCRGKIERADEHLRELGAATKAFTDASPYQVVLDNDEKARQFIGRAHIVVQPPPRIAAIVGDVVHNLRTALDYLAYELLLNSGASDPKLLRSVEFPVCIYPKGTNEHKTSFEGKVAGISLAAVALIESMQPCSLPGGPAQQALLDLNTLDIGDKHHALRVIGGAFVGHEIEIGQPDQPHYFKESLSGPAHFVSPLAEGAELFRLPPGLRDRLVEYVLSSGERLTQADVHGEVSFQVVLQEVRPGEDEAIPPFLIHLAQFVSGTIETFAHDCFP